MSENKDGEAPAPKPETPPPPPPLAIATNAEEKVIHNVLKITTREEK